MSYFARQLFLTIGIAVLFAFFDLLFLFIVVNIRNRGAILSRYPRQSNNTSVEQIFRLQLRYDMHGEIKERETCTSISRNDS